MCHTPIAPEPRDWRFAFRHGFARVLTVAELECLAAGLAHDDDRIIQGATAWPALYPEDRLPQDRPVTHACALGYACWQARGLVSWGQVEDHFARVAFETGLLLPSLEDAFRFLGWYDDTPREQMVFELLAEVRHCLDSSGADLGE